MKFYQLQCIGKTEGSHNGIAAVLKTASRKAMRVRLPRPPQNEKAWITDRYPGFFECINFTLGLLC